MARRVRDEGVQVSVPSEEVDPSTFVSDLDRCEHGRHAIDPCFGCEGGQSLGNPVARDILRYTRDGEVVIGYSLGGAYMYVLPTVEDSRTGPKIKFVERH